MEHSMEHSRDGWTNDLLGFPLEPDSGTTSDSTPDPTPAPKPCRTTMTNPCRQPSIRPFSRALACLGPRRLLAAALGAAALVGSVAQAHDDGKIRDRQRPVYGRAYRADVDGEGGVAGSFTATGVRLGSWLPLNVLSSTSTSGNSCWGYVSPAGREYAIIGISNGTAFVEVTNPGNAVLRSFQAGPSSLWRDVRVHGQYCYAASEAGSGIQVFDLSQLDASGTTTLVNTVLAPTSTTAATHTLAIDNASGYLYRAGGGSNGLRFYDLNANPANPTYVGSWSPIYVHECQVHTYTSGPYAGKQIAFCCGGGNSGYANTGLYVVDVTNKAAPVQLGFVTYPGARYCHQGWLDGDGRYFYINDELDEGDTASVTTTIVVNVENLASPVFVGAFDNGNTAIGHNLFVKGSLLFEANYRSGFRVFDLSQGQLNPPEVAFFDTYPGSDSPNFNGLWNIWPFFPSGTVIGSDIERGLFVWTLEPPVANFAVASAPQFVNPAGGTPIDVTVTPIGNAVLDPGSGRMTVTVAGTPIERPLRPIKGSLWRAYFPAAACAENVEYQFAVASTSGSVTEDAVIRTALSAAGMDEVVNHQFETAAGWVGGVAGDTATSGIWTRVDPVGTSAQPENDHSTNGTMCWVTGQGTVGGAAGAADVDGGVTTLLSPVFDLSAMDEPLVEYWYWYSNNAGSNPGSDSMPVQISNDGGATWVELENVATNDGAWSYRQWRVRDFVTPTASVRIRFRAQDLGAGSLVEAGVDDFRILNIDCTASVPGDVDGNGVVDAADLALVLSAWGAVSGPADVNQDGIVDAADLAYVIGAWTV